MTDVIHTESKKRIYTQQHIDCMTAILCFKRTGLPIAGIQEFFRLENDIPGNIDQMVAILKEHEQNTREKIERMESDLEHIQQKYGITARFAMRLKMGMKCVVGFLRL